jgi:hypothetical protein
MTLTKHPLWQPEAERRNQVGRIAGGDGGRERK